MPSTVGGYVEYDPPTGRYTLPPEQAVALTDPDSPAYLPGFFQFAIGCVLDSPRITEVAPSGAGLGLPRGRQRPGDDVRLPARHGRPGGGGAPGPPVARPRRDLDDRRAGGRATASRTTSTRSGAGGFTRFRRAAETPFNVVYEARP